MLLCSVPKPLEAKSTLLQYADTSCAEQEQDSYESGILQVEALPSSEIHHEDLQPKQHLRSSVTLDLQGRQAESQKETGIGQLEIGNQVGFCPCGDELLLNHQQQAFPVSTSNWKLLFRNTGAAFWKPCVSGLEDSICLFI